MNRLKVSKSKDYFEKDGKPFFYFADTVWSAFSHISLEEWEEYLDYRKMQGFNVLQINNLTAWDAGEPDTGLHPFKVIQADSFDFFSINDEYFDRAEKMLEMAVDRGFIPNLVLLWGNYVKDTWVAKNDPKYVMPLDAVEAYIKYAVDKFSRFNPMYMISGDVFLDNDVTNHTYKLALDILKKLCPESLTSMHLVPVSDIPEMFMYSDNLSYYMYQSGHTLETNGKCTYELPMEFYKKPVKRPIVNSEPCYEAHAHGGKYGRHGAFDVRRAFWHGSLSGAKAGFAYGAQGIWNWYREGKVFHEFGGKPLKWRAAMRQPGAWDAAFGKWIFEMYNLFDIEPVEDGVLNDTKEIRMSASQDRSKVVVYYPYNADIELNLDLKDYSYTLINLADRSISTPRVIIKNGKSVVKTHEFNADVLFVAIRCD